MAVLRPRKIREFPSASVLADGDLILIDKQIDANTTKTMSITAENFKKTTISGPFDNDTEAGNNGINLGETYYTPDGTVKVRLT